MVGVGVEEGVRVGVIVAVSVAVAVGVWVAVADGVKVGVAVLGIMGSAPASGQGLFSVACQVPSRFGSTFHSAGTVIPCT